jgi:hypothetical protein
VRAVIRRYFYSDNDDLSVYEADAPQVFGYNLTFAIGVEDSEGEDFFEVLVASAEYLAQRYTDQDASFLRHVIIAADHNVPVAVNLMTNYLSSLDEDSWEKLAAKINRVARWEFEDYESA